MPLKDLTGQKFGRLTVIERAENAKNGQARWLCQCECGNLKIVRAASLKRGSTQSCGCLKIEDLKGKKFSRLTVLEFAYTLKGRSFWKCRCSCGNICIVTADSLKNGNTRSCGCLATENRRLNNITHNMCYSWIYRIWQNIKTRCFNHNDKAYKNYGGRGITMFEAWLNDFQAFYDYVSQLTHFGEEGYTLDRIDNSKGYEPDNLRRADRKTQQRNTRRNVIVEYQGVKMTLQEAVEKSGINRNTLNKRIKAGDRGGRLFRPVENRR